MDTITNDILSYESIINNRAAFRKAAGKSSDEFNLLDFPGHKYFKILFYFWNDPNGDDFKESGGLLAPTWSLNDADQDFWRFNSAWGYLKNNAEEERADKLEKFVTLLSNISTYSPWYFKSITGIDNALERKSIADNQIKIEDQRQQISIACLQDAFDDRIGSLLDLYRDIVWSWSTKREILPANLRKFDMGVYIYESPINGLHDYNGDYAVMSQNDKYQTSYKYIEFHNCEIDYNSSKSGYGNVNNQEGFIPEYTINIFFDDCYEYRYNELMMRTIGDVVVWDTIQTAYSKEGAMIQGESNAQDSETSKFNDKSYNLNHNDDLNERLNRYYTSWLRENNINDQIDYYQKWQKKSKYSKGKIDKLEGYPEKSPSGILVNAIGQAINPLQTMVSSKLKKAFLGNLHGYSLSKFGSQLQDLSKGNIRGAVDAGIDYAKKAKTTHHERKDNIYHDFYSKHVTIPDMPEHIVTPDKKIVTSLGNLNKGKSIVNNL